MLSTLPGERGAGLALLQELSTAAHSFPAAESVAWAKLLIGRGPPYARESVRLHFGAMCENCSLAPIRGTRYHCAMCNADLCESCYGPPRRHYMGHIFVEIRDPLPLSQFSILPSSADVASIAEMRGYWVVEKPPSRPGMDEDWWKEERVHLGVGCNGCSTSPLRGTRYHCIMCPPGDFDLCASCHDAGLDCGYEGHVFMVSMLPFQNSPDVRRPSRYDRYLYPLAFLVDPALVTKFKGAVAINEEDTTQGTLVPLVASFERADWDTVEEFEVPPLEALCQLLLLCKEDATISAQLVDEIKAVLHYHLPSRLLRTVHSCEIMSAVESLAYGPLHVRQVWLDFVFALTDRSLCKDHLVDSHHCVHTLVQDYCIDGLAKEIEMPAIDPWKMQWWMQLLTVTALSDGTDEKSLSPSELNELHSRRTRIVRLALDTAAKVSLTDELVELYHSILVVLQRLASPDDLFPWRGDCHEGVLPLLKQILSSPTTTLRSRVHQLLGNIVCEGFHMADAPTQREYFCLFLEILERPILAPKLLKCLAMALASWETSRRNLNAEGTPLELLERFLFVTTEIIFVKHSLTDKKLRSRIMSLWQTLLANTLVLAELIDHNGEVLTFVLEALDSFVDANLGAWLDFPKKHLSPSHQVGHLLLRYRDIDFFSFCTQRLRSGLGGRFTAWLVDKQMEPNPAFQKMFLEHFGGSSLCVDMLISSARFSTVAPQTSAVQQDTPLSTGVYRSTSHHLFLADLLTQDERTKKQTAEANLACPCDVSGVGLVFATGERNVREILIEVETVSRLPVKHVYDGFEDGLLSHRQEGLVVFPLVGGQAVTGVKVTVTAKSGSTFLVSRVALTSNARERNTSASTYSSFSHGQLNPCLRESRGSFCVDSLLRYLGSQHVQFLEGLTARMEDALEALFLLMSFEQYSSRTTDLIVAIASHFPGAVEPIFEMAMASPLKDGYSQLLVACVESKEREEPCEAAETLRRHRIERMAAAILPSLGKNGTSTAVGAVAGLLAKERDLSGSDGLAVRLFQAMAARRNSNDPADCRCLLSVIAGSPDTFQELLTEDTLLGKELRADEASIRCLLQYTRQLDVLGNALKFASPEVFAVFECSPFGRSLPDFFLSLFVESGATEGAPTLVCEAVQALLRFFGIVVFAPIPRLWLIRTLFDESFALLFGMEDLYAQDALASLCTSLTSLHENLRHKVTTSLMECLQNGRSCDLRAVTLFLKAQGQVVLQTACDFETSTSHRPRGYCRDKLAAHLLKHGESVGPFLGERIDSYRDEDMRVETWLLSEAMPLFRLFGSIFPLTDDPSAVRAGITFSHRPDDDPLPLEVCIFYAR